VTAVYNDLLLAADSGQVSALCLLDLTAAFDTVDHDLLLLRGVFLRWFQSYLSGRSFRVVYVNRTSSIVYIVCSVPQGSVLGPHLFILYMADFAEVVQQYQVNFHTDADGNQFYLHCRQDDMMSVVDRLERCLTAVSQWMTANRLKLNAEKTELLWAGSRHSAAVLDINGPSLKLGQDTVAPSNHVRVLGVTFSSDLSLDDHVTHVSATCFYWLRQFRQVRRSLDDDAMKTLVHAFVTSRVHYCNAVLAGLPKSTTDTLQHVLNAAARFVSNTHSTTESTS